MSDFFSQGRKSRIIAVGKKRTRSIVREKTNLGKLKLNITEPNQNTHKWGDGTKGNYLVKLRTGLNNSPDMTIDFAFSAG